MLTNVRLLPMTTDAADIYHFISRFPIVADLGQPADVLRLFMPEGLYELANGQEARGHEAIRAMLKEFNAGLAAKQGTGLADITQLRHHVTSHSSQSAGIDKATAVTYFLAVTNHGIDHWGQWEDALKKTADGGWRLQRRTVKVEGSVAGSWFEFAYPKA